MPKYLASARLFGYPTLQDRLSAARVLIGKIAPDMKATELSGPAGQAIEIKTEGGLDAMAEAARRLAFIMAQVDTAAGIPIEPQDTPAPAPVTIEQPPVEVPIDPTRLPSNQRGDNRAASVHQGGPAVITKRRHR